MSASAAGPAAGRDSEVPSSADKHQLADQILATVNEPLAAQGLLLKAGTAVNAGSGFVHTVRGTSGNVSDLVESRSLLHGEETDVLGDAG